MISKGTFFSILLISLSIATLYGVKFSVHNMQTQISELDDDIAKHQDSIHVLQAEISYLTRPERLSAMQKQYFSDMQPTNNTQITLWLPIASEHRSAPTLLASR